MHYWLLKSEPSCYGIEDLKREKIGMWDGIRNYQARNMIRDDMRVGDIAFIYHSNANEIGIVGLGTIVSEAYPDPTQFDVQADHYDATSTKDNPRWWLVDVKFKKKFKNILTLSEIKNHPILKDMVVAQKGSRLSVQPVSKKHFDSIIKLIE